MNKKHIKLVIFLLSILIVVLVGYTAFTKKNLTLTSIQGAGQSPVKTGEVTGKLTGGYIYECNEEPCPKAPNIEICFENIDTLDKNCSTKPFYSEYSVVLPVGTYKVFSPSQGTESNTFYYSYYTEYQECYAKNKELYMTTATRTCETVPHQIKNIVVEENKTVANIDPADYVITPVTPKLNPGVHEYKELGFLFEYPDEKIVDDAIVPNYRTQYGGNGYSFVLEFDKKSIQGISGDFGQGNTGVEDIKNICTPLNYGDQQEKFITFKNKNNLTIDIVDGDTVDQRGIILCEKGYYTATINIPTNQRTTKVVFLQILANKKQYKNIEEFKSFLNTFKAI